MSRRSWPFSTAPATSNIATAERCFRRNTGHARKVGRVSTAPARQDRAMSDGTRSALSSSPLRESHAQRQKATRSPRIKWATAGQKGLAEKPKLNSAASRRAAPRSSLALADFLAAAAP